jgi:hypothetical protein
MQDVMYDATEVTPDPFNPVGGGGLNDLPDVPFDNQPIWLDPWNPDTDYPVTPDMTDFCLLTDAGETQEFAVTVDNKRLENKVGGIREAFIWYPCTLRAANALNKSVLNIFGGWSYEDSTSDNEYIWKYESENSWWHVDAINSSKVVLASATLSSITNYPRFATFAPSTPLEVAGFRIWIDEKEDYGVGDTVLTGSVNSDEGYLIPGLTTDNYYSIEASGGPWLEVGQQGYDFMIKLSTSDSYTTIGGNHDGVFVMGTPSGNILDISRIANGNYARAIIKAKNSYFWYCVNDDNFWNNSGTLGYIVKNSRISGNKLMTINNASLKNICGTGIL